MEERIQNTIALFNKEHKNVRCELIEDILGDFFSIMMTDLTNGRKIRNGLFEQDIELSLLSVEDIVDGVLHEMYKKLVKK